MVAQGSADLQARREALTRRIRTTSQLLANSGRDKGTALDQLVGLQKQIVQREELMGLLELQIAHADSSLSRTAGVVLSMERDMTALRDEYGAMLRAALRQQLLDDRLSFVLSAESMSQAFQRIRYLRRYDEYRRRQLELIDATQNSLRRKLSKLDDVKAEKEELLADELTQQQLLESELADKNELLKALQGDEARLRKQLFAQQGQKRDLDSRIDEVIAAAAEKSAAREAEKASASAKTGATSSSDYAAELSDDFAKNRGKLPWPVVEGFVSKPYGRRRHPTLKKVEVNNNGVDIRTEPGVVVRAVFEGEVVGLQQVPGYNTMVILQHGNYYTVYSKLVNVRVKPGARVGTADVIGEVAAGTSEGASELHFEVWRGRATQNPTRWVRGLQ